MVPWERSIYVGMLMSYLEQENEKLKQAQAQRR